MKTTLLHTITIAAALLFLSGMAYQAPAGQRHRTVTRNTEVTGVPAPIVDDSPINPDTAGKFRIRSGSKNDRPVNKPPRKRAVRR